MANTKPSKPASIVILEVLSLAALSLLIILEALNLSHEYTILLATVSAVFLGAAMGKSRWVTVSRDQLILTLEKIINSDPGALVLLSEKKRSQVKAQKIT
ncbi:MAG: hypothetical protein RQ757_06625 [Pseudomonadales bacterium]|nr:hypothetical protein [Pseudomonadales bacterium]